MSRCVYPQSLVPLCEVPCFFVLLHLVTEKLYSSCLVEVLQVLFTAASNFVVYQVPSISLDLIYRSFLPTRPSIQRVCDVFPHFCVLCICYGIRQFLIDFYFSVFFLCADDFWHFLQRYGITGFYPLIKLFTHWLVIHSTVKMFSEYGITGLQFIYQFQWKKITNILSTPVFHFLEMS